MYQENIDTIDLYWRKDELFDRLKVETASNARSGDVDAEAMTDDERYFFNKEIPGVLNDLIGYFRRVISQDCIINTEGTEIYFEFKARKNTENQFTMADIMAVDSICEKLIIDAILNKWYVSTRNDNYAKYYDAQTTEGAQQLLSTLFIFYRPIYHGAGYAVTAVEDSIMKD